jgi:hypothetical protein
MFVKPGNGLKIRDPLLGDFLPEGGREVTDSPYWQRRLRDQDVTTSTPAAPARKAAAKDQAQK